MALRPGVEIPIRAGLEGFDAAYAKMTAGAQSAATKMQASFSSMRSSAALMTTAIGAIGAGFAVRTFAGIVEATAKYKELSEKIGDTATAISSLRMPSATSGVAMDDVASASVRLTTALSKTGEESEGAGRALQALGLKLNDFKSLTPVEQLKALALAFSKFSDSASSGAAKTATAVALFGKQGAAMLPFLNDLADQHDKLNGLTKDQIEQADRLAKEWGRLKLQATDIGTSIASKLVPAITEMIDEMRDAIKISGGFWAALAAAGSLNPFDNTSQALTKARAELDALQKAAEKNGGKVVMPWSGGALVDATEEMKRLNTQVAILEARQQRAAARVSGDEYLDSKDLRWRGPTSKAELKDDGAPGKKVIKQVDEYARALDRVNKMARDAQFSLEEAFSGKTINGAKKALADLMASEQWGKLTGPQQDALKAAYARVDALQDEAQAWKDQRAAIEESMRALQASADEQEQAKRAFTASLGDYAEENAYIKEQIGILGKDELAREKLVEKINFERLAKRALMADDTEGLEILREQYDARLKLLDQLDAHQKKLADIADYNDIIGSSLSSLGQRLTSGQNPLEALTQAADEAMGRLSQKMWDTATKSLLAEGGPLGDLGKMLSDLFGTGGEIAGTAALTAAGATLSTSGVTLTAAGSALSAAAAALTAAAGASGAGSGAGGILGALFGSGSGGLGAANGSWDMIPAFAAGGNPPVGRWSLVGERGPELIRPRSATTVMSSDRTRDMMGGSTIVQHINVMPGATRESAYQAARRVGAATTDALKR